MASSYLNWHSGMKVVCVDSNFGCAKAGPYRIPTRAPILGEILTIRDLQPGETKSGVFLTFTEIDLIQQDGPLRGEIRWDAACFRPLETRKTDISVFTAMLNGAKERERA
ncbi:hypothetical protein MAUB1S_11438 [Mycolicibacterium aubagnense]